MKTYMSLFAGVGGFDAGFDAAGLECICQVERDKACLKTLAKHWPNVRRINDVRAARVYAEPKHAGRLHAGRLVRPDIVCGGFPCQDLSVAGKRAGLAGGRSGLFWTARRIVSLLKPAWFVLENVPGLLSSNGGRDMRAVVNALVASGYGVAWRVLDSQYFGLAQRRKRVFLVGCLGDVRRAAAVLFESGRCFGDTPPSREAGKETAGTLGGGSGSRGWSSDTDRMTFVPFAQNTREEVRVIGDGSVAGALGSETGTHQQTYVAAYGGGNPGAIDVATACNAHGSGRLYFESETFVASFDERNITSKGNRSKVQPGEPCHTLHESPPSVFAIQERACSDSLTSGPGGKGYQESIAYTLEARHHAQNVAFTSGVRRLLPVEYERLQGFPDGWTAGQPDSTRYRQLGNAVSVPVAKWIAERIIEVSKELIS